MITMIDISKELLSRSGIHMGLLSVHTLLDEVGHAHLVIMMSSRYVRLLISDLNRHESPGTCRRINLHMMVLQISTILILLLL